MKRTNLHIVEPAVIDITALNRADITPRDWAAVHVSGDRAPAINLPQRRKWSWS